MRPSAVERWRVRPGEKAQPGNSTEDESGKRPSKRPRMNPMAFICKFQLHGQCRDTQVTIVKKSLGKFEFRQRG
jgi:hypothetical protein